MQVHISQTQTKSPRQSLLLAVRFGIVRSECTRDTRARIETYFEFTSNGARQTVFSIGAKKFAFPCTETRGLVDLPTSITHKRSTTTTDDDFCKRNRPFV